MSKVSNAAGRNTAKNKAPEARERQRMPSHKIPTYMIDHPTGDVKELICNEHRTRHDAAGAILRRS